MTTKEGRLEVSSIATLLASSPLAYLLTSPAPTEPAPPDEASELAAREKRIELLACFGIVDKHARALSAAKPDPTPAIQAVGRWLRGDKLALLLLGPHDAGKTFAACAALMVAADRWLNTFVRPPQPAPRLVNAEHLHKAWLHRGEGYERCTRANDHLLLFCPLLVIDDLGQEAGEVSHITIEAVDTLLTRRSDKGLRTLVTSNLADYTAFEAYLKERGGRDQRVGQRLTEYGLLKVCPVEGYRQREAKP